MKRFRTIALVAAPLAVALTLAGCAGNSDESTPGMDHGGSSPSSSAAREANDEANAADAMFASMMIPHHEQAIEMSDMILAKSGIDQRVRDLAEQITAAQGPEIELMQSWLDEWGTPPAEGGHGMGHGGMMSGDDMAALEAAEGSEAAALFVEQMIAHHVGAIAMSQTEVEEGVNADAVELAQGIVDAQTAEIAEMQKLLDEL